MNTTKGHPEISTRFARKGDGVELTAICRRCFIKSPEWFVPAVLVARWWERVIADSSCTVLVLEREDKLFGFLVATSDYSAWKQLNNHGPHAKWMRVLVLITRPTFLKSFIRKRLRAATVKKNKIDSTNRNSNKNWTAHTEYFAVTQIVDGGSGLYLANMAVDPAARGTGAGKYIVERFGKLGEDLGVKTLWLHVDPRNERAQGLYSTHGYAVRGVDRSSLVMSRPVSAEGHGLENRV